MSSSLSSPRQGTKLVPTSPRPGSSDVGGGGAKFSPLSSPRTPRGKITIIKPPTPRKVKMMRDMAAASVNTPRIDVPELSAKIGASSNIKLRNLTVGDRIRNGGSGDSCLRLPLDCLSKAEIKEEMSDAILSFHHVRYQEDEASPNEEEEEAVQEDFDPDTMISALKPDKARFNIWKGTNYDLHLLGDFKSDFERRVKSFQRPETKPIQMDPFCRDESGFKDEPCRGEAFLVWKSKSDQWEHSYHNNNSQHDITSTALISTEEENEEDNYFDGSDADSIPDPEMVEYMQRQKEKMNEGCSPSGETLYFDEEFGVVRNLHRESHSLTNYGVMPDDTWIGRANIFYPEMSPEEKKSKNFQKHKIIHSIFTSS